MAVMQIKELMIMTLKEKRERKREVQVQITDLNHS